MGSRLVDPSTISYLDDKFDIILPFTEFNEHREEDLYESMLDEIQTFYFGEDATIDNETFPELVQVLSDSVFGYGVAKSADKHSTLSKGNTYFYR